MTNQMTYTPTPEQETLRSTVRKLMERDFDKEYWDKVEKEDKFPTEFSEAMAQLGLYGIAIPESYGGGDAGIRDLAIVVEELGRVSGTAAAVFFGTAVFCAHPIIAFGTDAQKAEHLPRIAAGTEQLSMSITEPGAGSDAGGMRTTAVLDGDTWVLNGEKTFCTGADTSDYIVMGVRTDPGSTDGKGLSTFLVPRTVEGFTTHPIAKLGHNGIHTCSIALQDVRLPRTALLGEVGGGWDILKSSLDVERTLLAAQVTGVMESIRDMAIAYAKEREQFGRPIATFQAISHMIVDIATWAQCTRLLVDASIEKLERGEPARQIASMAKWYGTESASRAASMGMQILGGYSYTKEYSMERHYRESKLYEIAGGSTQIQKHIIARTLGLPLAL